MKTKHTQGPWRIGSSGSNQGINYSILARKKNGWVNILHGNKKHCTETRATLSEAYANAGMMTAAPELFDACAAMLDWCDKNPPSGDALYFVQQARDAVAKATGHNAEIRGGKAVPLDDGLDGANTENEMDENQKHINLLLQIEAEKLIRTPTRISNKTKNLLKKHGLLDKNKLRCALTGYGLATLPGAGPATRKEACWWLIYGDDTCPQCGK